MLLFGLAAADVHAQVYAELSNGSNTDRGIVREQNISYYEEGGNGYFVYLPALSSGSVNQVNVPLKWSIRDFHVIDGVAYFCGTDLNNNTALLGHFNIGNLLLGNPVYFYRDINIGARLAVLNRMAVYRNKVDGVVSIMAIGREARGINPDMGGADRVVYIKDYASTAGCIFSNPDNTNELFWDVVLTDNYFVTAGTDTINAFITMRKVPIGTGLPAFPPIFRNGYKFPYSVDFVSGARMTSIKNDDVVIALYSKDDVFQINCMHLFTIDAQNAQMHYHQKHTALIYPYITGSLLPPREMVYLPNSTALMVIDTCSRWDNSSKSHILRLTPYPTVSIGSYYVPQYYYHCDSIDTTTKVKHNSLTVISPTSCITAAGDKWLKIDLQDPYLPPIAHKSRCITSLSTDCFIEPTYPTVPMDGDSSVLYSMVISFVKNSAESIPLLNPCYPNGYWSTMKQQDEIRKVE